MLPKDLKSGYYKARVAVYNENLNPNLDNVRDDSDEWFKIVVKQDTTINKPIEASKPKPIVQTTITTDNIEAKIKKARIVFMMTPAPRTHIFAQSGLDINSSSL